MKKLAKPQTIAISNILAPRSLSQNNKKKRNSNKTEQKTNKKVSKVVEKDDEKKNT